ncbi:MAG: tetratricopeptide repeat protein [Deltaproteobacteria bacterium]|nr:tetratricopeptide repeat protein [Deltaproteobacteria bacterium]
MDAVTYPDGTVVDFIDQNVIPLRIPSDDRLAAEFNVKWTPTLVTLDPSGKEHHRTLGFLKPEELIASVLLGIGKSRFETGKFETAVESFDKIIGAHPKSGSAPEAIFLRGVSLFKSTHDPKPLKAAYEKLAAEYPDNEWTGRAYPYRLLE